MLVTSVSLTDDVTNWKKAEVKYAGMYGPKPGYRMITTNGQSMSSSDMIAWDFTDGWGTPQNSNVQIPEIGLEDTFLAIGYLNTYLVPSSSGEVGAPADAPSVRSIFVFGDDATIVHNWPNGWSLVGVQDVQTINEQSGVRIAKAQWRYCWPYGLK